MSDQELVAPVAETQNTATEQTNELDVVTPEATAEVKEQTSEKDERDRAIKRMERRIDRKHAEAAVANERVRVLEERLASVEKAQPAPEKVEVDPRELERVIEERTAERTRIQTLNKQCDAVAEEGKKKFKDFDVALAAVRAEIPLFDQKGATPALQVILEADQPAALLHYLGTNPDVVSELADLTPTQLARRLDRIEREMAAKPKTSAAPKPIEPVSGKATASLAYSPEMTDTQYAKWREGQRTRK